MRKQTRIEPPKKEVPTGRGWKVVVEHRPRQYNDQEGNLVTGEPTYGEWVYATKVEAIRVKEGYESRHCKVSLKEV